jgi:hypothetical protein
MDPFAKKMWRAGFAFSGLLLLMGAGFTVVYVHARPRCGDRVVSEFVSPDRQWTATVLERRCGEDAPFVSRINIRNADAKLVRGFFSGQANQNNVFMVEQDAAGAGFNLDWNSPGQLTIRCRHCDPRYVHQQDTQHDSLTIRYELH